MLTAVIADCATESDRGRISGLSGLTSGLGALLALFGFLPIVTNFSLSRAYIVVGCCATALSVICFVWLRRDPIQLVEISTPLPVEEVVDPVQSGAQLVSSHYEVAKSSLMENDIQILLGYGASFLARADSSSLTLFIPLWVVVYYISIGKCTANSDLSNYKNFCHEAYVRGSILSGVAQTSALLAAPIFGSDFINLGYLHDKLNRALVVVISAVLCSCGYFLFAFTSTDTNMLLLYVVLIGFGEMGLIVSCLTLVTNQNIKSKGGVAGISSFFGGLGIILITYVGGALFDSWWSGAPFFILGIFHTALLFYAILVFIRT